jgi:4'-phosphopantetheinyl transferase
LRREVQIWVMRLDGLDEPAVAAWAAVLDASERARAARFVFPRNRVEYTAAHVLMRCALAEATGHPALAFRFEPGTHGKPTAWIGGATAGIHFNLSHTRGMVAVAVAPFEHGLDVEPLDRGASLSIADHYFCPEEIAWLKSLPEARQDEGFLRLWTLKEAFIKATGFGLSQGLDSFWFKVFPPAIRFNAAIAEDPASWWFEQRDIDGRFLAAVGFRSPPGPAPLVTWWQVEPAALAAAIHRSAPVSRRRVNSVVAPMS